MRIEMNGMVIEGTVEELREIGVKFPVEEEETQAPKFEVGDYAKVIVEGRWGDIEVGNAVKIVALKDDDDEYKAELLDGSDFDYFRAEQLEKVTEEEAKEIARWAKIGRKPGEFKKGDIVRVIDARSGVLEDGEIGVLGDKDESDGMFRVFARNVTCGNWYSPARFELIVPVEQRFDVAAEGARQ